MRLDGRTVAFLAAALGVSTRGVDRMLESVRRMWSLSGLLDGIEPGNGPSAPFGPKRVGRPSSSRPRFLTTGSSLNALTI